jgi:hypothetical protein
VVNISWNATLELVVFVVKPFSIIIVSECFQISHLCLLGRFRIPYLFVLVVCSHVLHMQFIYRPAIAQDMLSRAANQSCYAVVSLNTYC